MEKIFIFALLFLVSCQEETSPKNSQCLLVTISDALPVQFWLTGCDTYNEQQVDGVHQKCWCQPWNCSDEITIQFTDDELDPVDYSLAFLNDDGEFLSALLFNQVENGADGEQLLNNAEFDNGTGSTVTDWAQNTNFPDDDNTWGAGSGEAVVTVSKSTLNGYNDSKILTQNIASFPALASGEHFLLSLDAVCHTLTGSGEPGTVYLSYLFSDGGWMEETEVVLGTFVGLGSLIVDRQEMDIPDDAVAIGFRLWTDEALSPDNFGMIFDIRYINIITSNISGHINSLSIIPSNYGICDEFTNLVIYELGEEILENNSFDTDFTSDNTWTQTGGLDAWTWSAGKAVSTITTQNSNYLTQTFTSKPVGVYFADLSFDIVGFSDPIEVLVEIYLSGVLVQTIYDLDFATEQAYSNSIQFTALGSFDRIKVKVNGITTGVNHVEVFELSLRTAAEAAKSDCLDIKTAHSETNLIEYSNHRNYAGLYYEDVSPDPSFFIRVPSRFFHEVFPEEDEAEELTSSIITTNSQLKEQKLFEVIHAPYYFHKKLQLVIKHQTVEIKNSLWKKEEKYQINDGNKRWPLKSATCLLTKKNSVIRNVL